MRIIVTSIEEATDKYGTKKIFTDDKGIVRKLKSTSKAYNNLVNPGEYEITEDTYNGNVYTKWIKPINQLKDIRESQNSAKQQPQTTQKASLSQTILEDKLKFEIEKQKEIRLECYAGIAKDIVLANNANVEMPATAKDVMTMAKELVELHEAILNGTFDSKEPNSDIDFDAEVEKRESQGDVF